MGSGEIRSQSRFDSVSSLSIFPYYRINKCPAAFFGLNMQDIAPTLEHFYTFLNSPLVQFLLRIHPNDLATTQEANAPREFGEWSPWSREEPDGWLEIVHYYMTGNEYVPPLSPWLSAP